MDEFVLNVFSVGHFLIIFFAKSGVIRLGSGHLSIMLIDDAVRLLDFGAEGSLRILTDSHHFFRPSLVQSLLWTRQPGAKLAGIAPARQVHDVLGAEVAPSVVTLGEEVSGRYYLPL